MKKKSNIILLLGICSFFSVTACVDRLAIGDAFLEKSPGVDVNMDTVFNKAEYTRNFLWSAYGQLYCTYTAGNMMNGSPIDALSDSYHCYCTWGGPIQTYYPGNVTEDSQDNPDGNLQGKFAYATGGYNPSKEESGGRVSIYETVRKCWQIIDNIDRVPDMDEAEKSRLRGEAYTIMASRYFDAFRNFGGLCLVKKAYEVGENFTDGRATAKQTAEFIDSLCVCAINEKDFIWNIPNNDILQWSGRLTKASAMALRAKLWMFAASPLFNDDEPYMRYEAGKDAGTNIEHVWYGSKDPSLWDKCLKCCDDFFAENAKNGNYYQLVQPTSQDEAGYRLAYRRGYRYRNDETHHEKLFDVHPTTTMSGGAWGWGWPGFALDGLRQGGSVPTNELQECFGMQDGRNFPYSGIYGAGKNPQGYDMFADRDPRLYETVVVPRHALPSGVLYQGKDYVDCWTNGYFVYSGSSNIRADDVASGYGKFKWFLDFLGDTFSMDDENIGISYIRLAEMYLIRAEALAELGRNEEALDALHVVRSRVGLGRLEDKNPELNLKTNKENLINEIIRERNCELGAECGDRIYDMIRRKRQDLFTRTLHEIRIYPLDGNGQRLEGDKIEWDSSTAWPKFEYENPEITLGHRKWWDQGYWTNKWYLDPVSRKEIQKGYGLTQNPGW